MKRRATEKEIRQFIFDKLQADNCDIKSTFHQRVVLENIYPFSWRRFCDERRINQKILMDEHEKRVRRDDRITEKDTKAKVQEVRK